MLQPAMTVHVVMLSACSDLIGSLAIQTVPVVYLNQTRLDGPLNEWVLLNHLVGD